MNGLQIFTYESNQVRTVFREGEPWWVLKDVCDVLDLSNPSVVAARLDTDELTKFDLGGLSGQSNIVNESGLYNVILRSDKPEARKFRRWVTHEVLPSIRRTGKYATPKARQPRHRPVDIIFRQRLNMARDFAKITGVPLEIACAKAIEDAEKITGEDYTHWKQSLPARLSEAPIPHLNATGLGALAGVTARDANRQLAAAGLQRRVGKSWRLTEAGMRHGEEYPFERNGHSDYRILWRDSAADAIKEAHRDA